MTRFLTAFIFISALAGCGQKGPLTLPEAETTSQPTSEPLPQQKQDEQSQS